MADFDALRDDFLQIAGKAPSIEGFLAQGMGPSDDQFMSAIQDDIRDLNVAGVTVGLEYVDSTGNTSRRRVTLRRFWVDENGVMTWSAYCLERKALRTFRADRISTIIDLNGVVYADAMEFVTNVLRINQSPKDRPLHYLAYNGLVVLAALSLADGFMADEEIAVMIDYACEVAEDAGIFSIPEEELQRMTEWARRQHPETGEVRQAISAIHGNDRSSALLRKYAIRLMDADGIQHPSEINFIMALQDRLKS